MKCVCPYGRQKTKIIPDKCYKNLGYSVKVIIEKQDVKGAAILDKKGLHQNESWIKTWKEKITFAKNCVLC